MIKRYVNHAVHRAPRNKRKICQNRRQFKAWLAHALVERGIPLPPYPTYRDLKEGLEAALGAAPDAL